MNAVEKRIRKFATSLASSYTYNGVVEFMHSVADYIGGYSEEMSDYFTGLYEHIDGNGNTFKPLTGYEKFRVERMGARLILNPNMWDAVSTFVRLHHMLKWDDGESAMIALTDKLYNIAEKDDAQAFKEV